MMKKNMLVMMLALFSSAFVAPLSAAEKPNVLLIVLDDVGYSDIGAFGSEIDTPNMDRLANEGLRFNNFHVTPTCSPSRAALLTARDSHRVGMGLVTEFDLGPEAPAFRGRITEKAATLPEVLGNKVGSYMIGKWHLTPPSHQNAAGPFNHWPLGEGFDRFYGFLAGSTNQFSPGLVSDNTIIDVSYEGDQVVTTDLVDHAIQNVRDHVSLSPERPFFMYLSMPGMHSPHQASDAYLEKYAGKYNQGWDKVRQARFNKQKATGLIPSDAQLPEFNRKIKKWDRLNKDSQKVYAKFQEVYAGMLDQTDYEIGRLLETLEVLGQWDNTIIMVMSDNGASNSGFWHGAANSTAMNNGVKATVKDNLKVLDNLGREGSGVNYPRGWAQASNTPFPYYKTQPFGGGVNSPLIVHWPAGIKDKGSVRDQYHHITDIMPTLMEIYGEEIPTSYQGVEQLPVDGMSMSYAFNDANAESKRNTQLYRMGDHRGIYHDGWTAVALHRPGTDLKNDFWFLYDLKNDFTQSTNLVRENPEKLKALQALWQQEAKRVGADMMFEPRIQAGDVPEVRIRENFELFPGIAHIPEKSTPKVMGRSFTIRAPLHRDSVTQRGVIVAHGSSQSGYVLYVKNNRLVFEYNFLASVASEGQLYRVESKSELPVGAVEVGINFVADDDEGEVELLINGKVVGSEDIDQILMARIAHEGLDVGQDRYSQVGQGYKGNFPFNGTIEKVVYKIDPKGGRPMFKQ